ncbi:MAG TPA: magnesium transporter [Abditibacteriaceae bacterium]|jgi:magnesium transporter
MSAATSTSSTLAERLRRALRTPFGSGGDLAMTAALRNQHPADIAEAMGSLSHAEALAVFNWLDNARAAKVLGEVDGETSRYLLDHAPAGRIADLLDRLPMDDAAEVVSDAHPERAEELLAGLEKRAPEDAAEVRELLSYEDDSAGRLMTDNFIRLAPDMTIEEAFAAVRGSDPEVETLTELYVVEPFAEGHQLRPVKTRPDDEEEKLIGVVPLRLLVNARGDQRIRDIMIAEPLTVSVDADQEAVARIFDKYSFLAVPVLDRRGALAGIVTMDDIIHVLVEEQTEDVLALGAVSAGDNERSYLAQGVVSTVKQRFGWLLLLFVASMFTGGVSRHFEPLVDKMAALATFIPLLIGTGGNAGAQAVMTVTRALALGEVDFRDWVRVLWREIQTGLVLGAMLAFSGFFFVLLGWGESGRFAFVIAGSLITIVMWASIVGSLLPLAAKRLGFDPAVMSAPFITTLVDATGLFVYFSIARTFLHL